MASYTMVPASLQGLTMGSRRDAKYCLCKSTTKLAWFLHHVRQRFCSDEHSWHCRDLVLTLHHLDLALTLVSTALGTIESIGKASPSLAGKPETR
ncbi:BnaC06g07080D [Brassica napus]|uniref:BnaC06g07080D protein n=1 Tax=Brassica napus TaxID=3708 RepID=A0A078H5E6_BRANA|nr:BnaC06g07080D [Brassica napus]